ncbi:hypothetical protein JCM8115_002758 [Rhodotorula mucilaginosa]
MPVGHLRINDPKPNPNDNITFIRVLEDRPDSDQALKILEALAAQFKPIMKEWGFGVNSLVEYEWNTTFAGRNWNAGEVVEIVLRRRDGSFAPYQFLLYVMCHELAHIREMNHSWAFQKVNSQLRASLARLRAQNYYGDGFWSSGRSLQYPNAEVPAAETELATLTCGGANKKSRGRRRRRQTGFGGEPQRERGSAVKLGTTGRQTAIARKAGGRVSKKNAFVGQGQVLSEDPAQSTFKRRAQAQQAIEARAAAAEARIAAEKRARAAEGRNGARASGPSPKNKKPKVEIKGEVVDVGKRAAGPSPTKKPKIEIELSDSDAESDTEDDDDEDAHDVGGGWETDEEDKPAVQLDEEEKRWLESDMRHWEQTFADDGEDVKPVVESSGSAAASASQAKAQAKPTPISSTAMATPPPVASGSGSSKRSRKASPPTPLAGPSRPTIEFDNLTPEERAWLEADAATPDATGSAAPPIASGSDVSSKRSRKANSSPRPPHLEIDDLTPEERAWLEADMAVTDTGVEDGCGGSGGGRGKVAYMPMPAWMGGEPPLLSSSSSSHHRQRKNSSDVDMIVDDFSDDEDEADKKGRSARLDRSVAGPSRPPAVRSFPRPKAKGSSSQPVASRAPGKEKQQQGRGWGSDWYPNDTLATSAPPLPKKAKASTTGSASGKEKQQSHGWTSAWDPDDGLETILGPSLPKKKAKASTTRSDSTQMSPPSFAPIASTSKSSSEKATSTTGGPPLPTKSTKQIPKKLSIPGPPVFKPFSNARRVLSQQSTESKKLVTPAAPKPSLSKAPPPELDQDNRKFALPAMTTHSTCAFMPALGTVLPPSPQSGTPKPKKQRFAPPSDSGLQDFDLEVFAPPASRRPAKPSNTKARPLYKPKPQRKTRTHSDKPYERGSDADISSSASSVCSIPPALRSGVLKLSEDELSKVLESLDLQCKYNERLAKKHKRRQKTLSRSGPALAPASASTAGPPVKKRKTLPLTAGGAITTGSTTPSANKPKPTPSSSSVKAGKCDPQSQPVRARKSSIGDSRSMDDILEEAASKQRIFIDQMEREGKLWRCGVCDFHNAAVMPTCEFCSIGSALAATEWSKPA